jgi:hypothetical protein
MLQARKLIYYKKVPGDCPTQNVFSSTGITATRLAGSAASGTVGLLGAAGVVGGIATAGIGIGVSAGVAAIAQIFTHHAQAVATEQETICSVTDIMNQILAALDAAVIAGKIDAGDAQSILKNYANQAITTLGGIEKSCNAACYFDGYINAQVDFRNIYWPQVSPLISGGNVSNPANGSSIPVETLGPPTLANTPQLPWNPTQQIETTPAPSYIPSQNAVNAALPAQNSNFWLYATLGGLVLVLLISKG